MKKSRKNSHSIFKRIPMIKDAHARAELGRAHLLVALLAFALLLTLYVNLQPGYVPDLTLSVVAIVLLVIVGLLSLTIAGRLYLKRLK